MKIFLLTLSGLFFSIAAFAQTESAEPEKVNDPVAYIKKESVGGTLDFQLLLEDNKLYGYDGVAYSKDNFATLLWGQAVKRIGIQSSKEATKLWEEINGRSLTDSEKKALVKGYKMTTK